ncbi:helix-turn-helix domain-containing protein [Sphingobium herbicidovorans]|uniref:helix-turn-helix domain-containing protein n=1 Tax=Sphingobium herbicidovorans TaxID=76947 RepID=UPI00055B72A2|nr:helix-turn-helix domain-containing protein [Sphingobium herbicidovorans]
MAEPALLSLIEAADFLGLHPNTVRRYVRQAVIPGGKIGRDWRFVEADLVAWLRGRYPDDARMHLGADDKEALWHSGNVQIPIMLTSQPRTEAELNILLAQPTGKKRRNTTTS